MAADGSSSRLSRAKLVDRIKGTIYGHALGDARGLATEFLSQVCGMALPVADVGLKRGRERGGGLKLRCVACQSRHLAC